MLIELFLDGGTVKLSRLEQSHHTKLISGSGPRAEPRQNSAAQHLSSKKLTKCKYLQHLADVGILILFLEQNMPLLHCCLINAPEHSHCM